jgi:hypothetical protein
MLRVGIVTIAATLLMTAAFAQQGAPTPPSST